MIIYTDSERKSDFQWFLDNYEMLYQQYGHKYFAIQNKKIIGIFEDKNEAIDITSQLHEIGTFIVQECNGNDSVYMCYITSWELIN